VKRGPAVAVALCVLTFFGLLLAGGLGYGGAGIGAAARAIGQARTAATDRPADSPRSAAHEFEYLPSTSPAPVQESCKGGRWKRRGFPSRQACEDFTRKHG
jgi:hypothetical protein